MNHTGQRLIHNIRFCFICMVLSGCALTYEGPDGTINHIGLMHLRYQPGAKLQVTDITEVGAGLNFCSDGAGAYVGYQNRVRVDYPGDDQSLLLDYNTRNPFATQIHPAGAELWLQKIGTP